MSKKKQVKRAQERQRTRPKKAPASEVAPGATKPGRQERLEDARRARRRRSVQARVAVATVAGVIIFGALGWKLQSDRAERQAVAAMTAGDCRFDRRSDPGAVNEHAANPTFKVEPPSGGIHDATAASPGDYDEASTPPDGKVVHALEHGDIALWHRDGLPEPDMDSLQSIVDEDPDVLLAPRPGLDAAVAAVAWHKRLLCASVDLDAINRFIERYADEGPENQPEDASGGGTSSEGVSGAVFRASNTT